MKWTFIVPRCTSRTDAHCANPDFRSPGVPAGFPHVDVPFSTASDFRKFQSHLNFHFLFLFFLRAPEMDTYPAEEHLTPNIVNTTKTDYVPVSMVCTHLKGSRFFLKKHVESILKVRRIELIRKAEPTR